MTPLTTLTPSKAHIWGAGDGCTGWAQMSARYPSEPNPVSVALRTLANTWLHAELTDSKRPSRSETVGASWNGGAVISPEMYEAAGCYVETVAPVFTSAHVLRGLDQHVTVEPVHPQVAGRLSAYAFDVGQQVLHVWDFRTGYTPVEAVDSPRLILYALGVSAALQGLGREPPASYSLNVVQPLAPHRAGVVRTWRPSPGDVSEHARVLAGKAGEALGPNAVCKAGAYCRECGARGACVASQTSSLMALDYLAAPVPVDPSPEQLGYELALLRLAERIVSDRKTAIEAQTVSILRQGVPVPGFFLEPSRGALKWSVPPEQIQTTADLLGVNLKKPPSFLTPTQAKAAGVPAALIDSMSHRPDTGLKLAVDDGSLAKTVFSRD